MTASHQSTSMDGSESCKTMGWGGQRVRFNKFNVALGAIKARVLYSLDNRIDNRKCVTLYAKDFGHTLRKILGNAYENKTDRQSDYFDQGKAVLFESHPLYAAARVRAETV